MPEIEEGSIEILLQRIVFRGFKSKDTIVTLSFVASKKNREKRGYNKQRAIPNGR